MFTLGIRPKYFCLRKLCAYHIKPSSETPEARVAFIGSNPLTD